MYLSYFGITKEPFQLTPDQDFLYMSPSHKEALGTMVHCIRKMRGFGAITGEVGTGKTTVVRAVLAQADLERVKPVYIFNAHVSFKNLLRTVFRELGIAAPSNDTAEMVSALQAFLIQEFRRNVKVALIVDEAQNLPVETLADLHLLSNLETAKDKLLQIILVGQPELIDKLDLYELRQIKQRIAMRVRILPLTKRESFEYIQYRLAKAERSCSSVFTKGALKRIVQASGGIPRTLNILCENSLIAGYGYRTRPVTARIAKEVVAEYQGKPFHRWLAWRLGAVVAAAAGLILAAATYGRLVSPPSEEKEWSRLRPTRAAALEEVPDETPAMPAATMADMPASAPLNDEAGAAPAATEEALSVAELPAPDALPGDAAEDSEESPLAAAVPANPVDSAVPPLADSPAAPPGETTPTPEALENTPDYPGVRHTEAARSEAALAATEALVEAALQPVAETPAAAMPAPVPAPLPYTAAAPTVTGSDDEPLVRTVQRGDNLSRMAQEVYGFSNARIVQTVRDNNPGIRNVDLIFTGDQIVFPKLEAALGSRASAQAGGQ